MLTESLVYVGAYGVQAEVLRRHILVGGDNLELVSQLLRHAYYHCLSGAGFRYAWGGGS